MEKIVLVGKKTDERLNTLIECLKHLFPECSMELLTTDQKSLSKEKK